LANTYEGIFFNKNHITFTITLILFLFPFSLIKFPHCVSFYATQIGHTRGLV
jgi:hypothetical protein